MVTSEDFEELQRRAASFGQTGSYGPAAVEANTRVLELDPGNEPALRRLARCHEESGNWLAAHNTYRLLLDLGTPDSERVEEKVAETQSRADEQWLEQQREQQHARKRVEELEARANARLQALRVPVEAVESFREAEALAIAAREARNFEVALRYHNRSLELAGSNQETTRALSAIASTFRRARRPTDALVALKKSLDIEPSHKPSRTSLIAVLRETGNLKEAQASGEQLLAEHPDDPFVLMALGKVLRERFERDGDVALLDRASTYYQRAAALHPQDRDVLKELRGLVKAYKALGTPTGDEKAHELQQRLQPFERRPS